MRVAEPARVLPRASAPKPSPPGVSVPAAVAVLMDSRMETTALGEIVHQQRVRQKEEVQEETKRRGRILIEALPIEPVVKVKQHRKPVDRTKKQHLKAVGPYHGTLGLPTEAELVTGLAVTQEGEQLVIEEKCNELNAARPVMVDGKLKELLH